MNLGTRARGGVAIGVSLKGKGTHLLTTHGPDCGLCVFPKLKLRVLVTQLEGAAALRCSNRTPFRTDICCLAQAERSF
jgi:hypothetical protein